MALNRPFTTSYEECGCFEYHASGEGLAKVTRQLLDSEKDYNGILKVKEPANISSHDVFEAYEAGDPLADKAVGQAVVYWGMAVANLVSIFNPEKIIFGGGVFGPASRFLPAIMEEARKWAQPLGINQVSLELSGLGSSAGVYGAAFLALKNLNKM